MKYSIHKDKKPKETVKTIKKILKELGIKTKEYYIETDYPEKTYVRILIKGTELGKNGKGTCTSNCLASGYGEFMERLQPQLTLEFSKEPDAICCGIKELKNNIYVKNELNKDVSVEQLVDLYIRDFNIKKSQNPYRYYKFDDTKEKIHLIPFVSVKTRKKVYIPEEIKRWVQASSGYAAGNTYEEAFVQALSEICERYEQRKIIRNQIHLPNVPEEYYNKYDNIINLKSYIESKGYKITVKDGSCGELPVIITLFENIKNPHKNFIMSAASHPCITVAIERTLTEFLQGIDINKHIFLTKFEKYIDIDSVLVLSMIIKISIEDSDYFDFLFEDKKDYEFNPKIWEQNDSVSNKTMAKSLMNKVLNITDDIYIRNYSFLGIPTISLYVPKMIHIYEYNSNYYACHNSYLNIIEKINSGNIRSITAEEIYYFCKYYIAFQHIVCGVFIHLVQVMSAIILNDEVKIKKSIYLYKKQAELLKIDKAKIKNIEALQKYFNLKENKKSKKEINKLIKKEYGEEILNKIINLKDKTTLERIRLMLLKFIDTNRKDIDIKEEKIIAKIRKVLKERYIKDFPEQEHFMDFLYD